jgi:type IV pilus assembly protein PilA
MTRILCIFAVAASAACGPKVTPRDRYVRALNYRLEGNAHAQTDELIALAHEEPQSRAGRRARATLVGGDWSVTVATIGVLAAIAIPNFLKFQARSRQSEAKTNLKTLYVAQKSYFAEYGKYGRSFNECAFSPEPGARYLYFLSRTEVVGGDAAGAPPGLRERAAELLEELKLRPEVKKQSFLAVAVGNIDDDETLDVWAIDADNNLENRQSDVE